MDTYAQLVTCTACGQLISPTQTHICPGRPWTSPASEPVPDVVNSPLHYTRGGIECIDAIRAALTPEEFRGFCKGNIIKYIWRERHKGGDVSVEKAGWYGRQLTEIKA